MEIVYFTLIAVGLYLACDRLLDWFERQRGERLKNRSLVFFAMLLASAIFTFWLIRILADAPV